MCQGLFVPRINPGITDEVGAIIIPLVWTRRPKLREAKYLAQITQLGKQQSKDLN